jgi:hypothetical protein
MHHISGMGRGQDVKEEVFPARTWRLVHEQNYSIHPFEANLSANIIAVRH